MMLILFAFVFSFLHVSGLLGADVSDGYSSLVLVYRGDELHGSGAIVGDTGERKHRIVVTNQHVTLGSDIVGILFPGFENVDGKSRISNLSFKEEEIEWHLTLASCRFGLLSKQLCDSRRLYWGTTTEKTLSRCHGYELVDYIYETNDKGQSTIEGVIKYGSFSIGRTIYEDRHLDIALIETCVDFDSKGIVEIAHCGSMKGGEEVRIYGNNLDGVSTNDGLGLWRMIPGIFDNCNDGRVNVTAFGAHGRSGGPVLTMEGKLLGIHAGSNKIDESYEIPAEYLVEILDRMELVELVSVQNSTDQVVVISQRCSPGEEARNHIVHPRGSALLYCPHKGGARTMFVDAYGESYKVRTVVRRVVFSEDGKSISSEINARLDARRYTLKYETGGGSKIGLECERGGRPPACERPRKPRGEVD